MGDDLDDLRARAEMDAAACLVPGALWGTPARLPNRKAVHVVRVTRPDRAPLFETAMCGVGPRGFSWDTDRNPVSCLRCAALLRSLATKENDHV